jgi:hypothetical protein
VAIGQGESLQPTGAAAFARQHGLQGHVLNAYGLGGYLIYSLWPETQVLVDGRNDMVYPAEFVAATIEAGRDSGAFAALLQDKKNDGATWAMGWNRPELQTHLFLARDPQWALVYWDDVATIYVRRAAHPELEPLRYQLIDPAAVEAQVARLVAFHTRPGGDSAILRRLNQELLRMVEAAPDSLRANGALLIFYAKMGQKWQPQRDAVLRRLDEIAPGRPSIRLLREHLGIPPNVK